jgi:hypothetical protein
MDRPKLKVADVCVVPGGGIFPDGDRWVSCRSGFFLPVRVLSRLFRRFFLEFLQKAFDDHQLHFFSSLHQLQDSAAFSAYLAPLRQAEWVVYGARSFISADSLPANRADEHFGKRLWYLGQIYSLNSVR